MNELFTRSSLLLINLDPSGAFGINNLYEVTLTKKMTYEYHKNTLLNIFIYVLNIHMIMGKFKQTLLTQEAYSVLKDTKELMEKTLERKVSFTEIINKFIKKPYVIMSMDQDIKNYIFAFIDNISLNPHILGIILFGSIAKSNYNNYSDIDIAILTDYKFLECFNYLNDQIKNLVEYEDKLISRHLSLYLSPLIITQADVSKFNPIYFDILDNGIVLHQRKNIVSDFLLSLAKIKHKRLNNKEGELLLWQ